MAKKNETPITQDEDILDLIQGGEEKRTPAEEVIEDGVSAEIAEAVEVENEPVAEAPKKRTTKKTREPEQEEPKAALTAASRTTSTERRQMEEERIQARSAKQQAAVIAGGYLNAKNRNNVVTGVIAGVENRGKHAFWVIYDGPVTVMIPFHEALPTQTKPEFFEETEDALNAQNNQLAKSIGVEVPFTVEHIEAGDGEYFVFGSRKKALERISKRYFGPRADNPTKMGDMVIGTILCVGAHAVWVTANGVDIRIPAAQLSYRYMENLEDYYVPGDKITVQVQREMDKERRKQYTKKPVVGDVVEMGKDGRPLMSLSALPSELQECHTRLSRIRRGSRYQATISSMHTVDVVNEKTKQKEKRFQATCWLEGVELAAFANVLPAKRNERVEIRSGMRVLVEVQGVANSGYVRVDIKKYLV